jgi:hypothetical protein
MNKMNEKTIQAKWIIAVLIAQVLVVFSAVGQTPIVNEEAKCIASDGAAHDYITTGIFYSISLRFDTFYIRRITNV